MTLFSGYPYVLLVTPFDVVKTRLQTQPVRRSPLFPHPPPNVCCQPANIPCVRRMSTAALPRSLEGDVVCVWEHGMFRTERVTGFLDAVRHVWRVEGISGLWKGAGTSLCVVISAPSFSSVTIDILAGLSMCLVRRATCSPMITSSM